MARDYKTKRKAAAGFPGWLGLVCGLAVGLAVAGLIYFKDRHSDTPTAQSPKPGGKKAHVNEPPDAEAGDSGAPEEPAQSYDFYSMLPKFEVVVPEKERGSRTRISPTRIASARNSRCRASNRRCKRCRSTTIPGTASGSGRFRSWTN